MVSQETMGFIESMKGVGIALMGFVLIIIGYLSGDPTTMSALLPAGVAMMAMYYGKHTQSSVVDQLMAVIKEAQIAVKSESVTHITNDLKTGTKPTIEDIIKIVNDPIVLKTLTDAKEVTPELVKPIIEDIERAKR